MLLEVSTRYRFFWGVFLIGLATAMWRVALEYPRPDGSPQLVVLLGIVVTIHRALEQVKTAKKEMVERQSELVAKEQQMREADAEANPKVIETLLSKLDAILARQAPVSQVVEAAKRELDAQAAREAEARIRLMADELLRDGVALESVADDDEPSRPGVAR